MSPDNLRPLPQVHRVDERPELGAMDHTPHAYDAQALAVEAQAEIPELHEIEIPGELLRRLAAHRHRYPQRQSASIPALWEVQKWHGWCSPQGIRQAAAVLELTPAFLESVASFYDMLKLEPVGRHSIMVCTNISCWLNGADELMQAFADKTGAPAGRGTSPDGNIELEHFECLGACDLAPMASVDYRYYGPLELDDVQTIIEQLKNGDEVLPEKALPARPAAGGELDEIDDRVAEHFDRVMDTAARVRTRGADLAGAEYDKHPDQREDPVDPEPSDDDKRVESAGDPKGATAGETEATQAASRAPDAPAAADGQDGQTKRRDPNE
ncbi:MAG: NAD(P)H-dependent oxidoreductase subunit E [Solirubrobacterales bacterium]